MLRASLPKLTCQLRILHAAAGAPSVDIYANGKMIIDNLSFSDISKYITVEPDNYKIEVYESGKKDNPISSEDIVLLPQTYSTTSLILDEGSLVSFTLIDGKSTNNPRASNLRFINLSTDSNLISLKMPNGKTLFNDVEYLETTNYYELNADNYDFILSIKESSNYSTNKIINNLQLNSDKFYTLYIIGLVDGNPQLGYLLTIDM